MELKDRNTNRCTNQNISASDNPSSIGYASMNSPSNGHLQPYNGSVHGTSFEHSYFSPQGSIVSESPTTHPDITRQEANSLHQMANVSCLQKLLCL